MTTLLKSNPKLRSVVITTGLFFAMMVISQFILPGRSGGEGTPGAILFQALVDGMLNALPAVALVLIYRTTRVFNFAQEAFGAAGGALTFQLVIYTKVPFFVALVLGVIVAALCGLLFDTILGRRFFNAPRLVLTVATIAATGLLLFTTVDLINKLPFLPDMEDRDIRAELNPIRDQLPFSDWDFQVGGLAIKFGFPEVLAIVLSLIAILALTIFLNRSKVGVAIRALAENVERAALLGIGTGTLTTIVWTIAGFFGGLDRILSGAISTPGAAGGVLLPAFAAAVLARMHSIPTAMLASVGLALGRAAVVWSYPTDEALVDVVFFLVIGVGLLVQRKSLLRSEEGGGVTWEATAEQRTVPRELRGITGIRVTRLAFIVIAIAAVALYPFVVSTGPTVLGGVIALNGILALSLLVLTGWGGQVSLGQLGIAAVGGVIGAALTGNVGLSFWLAVPLATAVAAGFAVLVGIPALRIKGLFLAVSTFALGIAVWGTLFNERYFGWLLPDIVNRPTLFLLDFEDEKSMYFLCVAALALAIVVVSNLRRSRFGRMLIAVRENDANVQTLGVSAVRIKLMGFAVSGALAGFAGAMSVHLQRGVAADSFLPQRGIDLFLICILGGIGSPIGVLLGTLYYYGAEYFLSGNIIFQSIQPMAVLTLLYIEPAGLIGIVNRLRDGVLRIVAQRRQIIVPSLFADIDPDALSQRLIPLAEPMAGAGLAAVGGRKRFALRSELYAGPGKRITETLKRARPSREGALISAAAGAADDAAIEGTS